MSEKENQSLRVAVLGSSRGLGRSLVEVIQSEAPEVEFFLASRRVAETNSAATARAQRRPMDFSKPADALQFFEDLKAFNPDRIFYVAGGGPHGPFEDKKWADHEWAFEVSFRFPARLLHFAMNEISSSQVIFIGSAVAESSPDPLAASYAAAKHALKGLITTVQEEQKSRAQPQDIRIYSAPYMLTDLLPLNAWPRQKGLAQDPKTVARHLWQWSLSSLV